MKIGFFGTPDIAAFCLESLSEKYSIDFVVTGEDKEVGRNRKLKYNPVKSKAIDLGIEIFQPTSLKEESFLKQMGDRNVDIFVVVAYGKFIPKELFELPKYKTINLHPSKLPKYRGAAPIQTALMDGVEKTGITVQLINEKMDAGDIVLQKDIDLNSEMSSSDLYDLVLPEGAALLNKVIDLFEKNEVNLIKQNESDVTFCGKIDRNTAQIDWGFSAIKIHNLVRGLNPKPVAWTTFRNNNVKIWQTTIPNDLEEIVLKCGEIGIYKKKRLVVGTGEGIVEILEIQPQAKKVMDAVSFINGSRLVKGDHFVFENKNS